MFHAYWVFFVYYFRNFPFQKAVKQSLRSCMVEMKDSVYWSKKISEKNTKLELQIIIVFFLIYSE